MRLDGPVEPARDVRAELADRNPLHRVQLSSVRYLSCACEYVARHVDQVLAGGRVDPFAEHPSWRDRQAGLLKNFPDRGGLRALARLDLPAGQHPPRGAVIRAAARQQDAALPDDDGDGDGETIGLCRKYRTIQMASRSETASGNGAGLSDWSSATVALSSEIPALSGCSAALQLPGPAPAIRAPSP